jgi:hypothetical protein
MQQLKLGGIAIPHWVRGGLPPQTCHDHKRNRIVIGLHQAASGAPITDKF